MPLSIMWKCWELQINALNQSAEGGEEPEPGGGGGGGLCLTYIYQSLLDLFVGGNSFARIVLMAKPRPYRL